MPEPLTRSQEGVLPESVKRTTKIVSSTPEGKEPIIKTLQEEIFSSKMSIIKDEKDVGNGSLKRKDK